MAKKTCVNLIGESNKPVVRVATRAFNLYNTFIYRISKMLCRLVSLAYIGKKPEEELIIETRDISEVEVPPEFLKIVSKRIDKEV